MKAFISEVETRANHMAVAGLALEAISDLLGCDGAEHHIDSKQMLGLAYAVQAIGSNIREHGYGLCVLVEEELSK